jgi:hypothetical protein
MRAFLRAVSRSAGSAERQRVQPSHVLRRSRRHDWSEAETLMRVFHMCSRQRGERRTGGSEPRRQLPPSRQHGKAVIHIHRDVPNERARIDNGVHAESSCRRSRPYLNPKRRIPPARAAWVTSTIEKHPPAPRGAAHSVCAAFADLSIKSAFRPAEESRVSIFGPREANHAVHTG